MTLLTSLTGEISNPDQVNRQMETSNNQLDVEYQDVSLAESSPVQSVRFQVSVAAFNISEVFFCFLIVIVNNSHF